MTIDVHTHAFPDTVAGHAVRMLERMAGLRPFGDGTVDGLLRSMDCADIDMSVVLPVATRATQVPSINRWAAGIGSDRIIPFGSLFPGMKAPGDEASFLAGQGVPGVKLHPEFQVFYPDDPAVFPVYEACIRHGLAVLIHSGTDIYIPPPVHGTPDRIARVSERYPELRLIAAHMGGLTMWDEGADHLAGRDVFVDTSMTFSHIGADRLAALIGRFGADRVMFGTDWPWQDQATSAGAFARVPLAPAARRSVAGINARRLLLPDVPCDREGVGAVSEDV